MFFRVVFLSVLILAICSLSWARSTDGSIPQEVSCAGDCPAIGVSWSDGQQAVSPVANDCVGAPMRVLLGQLGVVLELANDQCPLWVLIQPPRSAPVARTGCCILNEITLQELQQPLECQCNRWFLICWDQDCQPVGEPRRVSEITSYMASPCPGQQPVIPCNAGLN